VESAAPPYGGRRPSVARLRSPPVESAPPPWGFLLRASIASERGVPGVGGPGGRGRRGERRPRRARQRARHTIPGARSAASTAREIGRDASEIARGPRRASAIGDDCIDAERNWSVHGAGRAGRGFALDPIHCPMMVFTAFPTKEMVMTKRPIISCQILFSLFLIGCGGSMAPDGSGGSGGTGGNGGTGGSSGTGPIVINNLSSYYFDDCGFGAWVLRFVFSATNNGSHTVGTCPGGTIQVGSTSGTIHIGSTCSGGQICGGSLSTSTCHGSIGSNAEGICTLAPQQNTGFITLDWYGGTGQPYVPRSGTYVLTLQGVLENAEPWTAVAQTHR
jgi:hypothetical protein